MLDLRNELNIVLPQAKGAYLESVPDLVWTEPGWVLEPKEDGNRATLTLGIENSLIQGRNRKNFMKGVAQAGKFMRLPGSVHFERIISELHNATILDGEETESYKKNGAPSKKTAIRVAQGEFVGLTVWDCLFHMGKDLRGEPLWLRRSIAKLVIRDLAQHNIRLITQIDATKKNLETFFERGKEGAIAKNINHTIPTDQKTHPGWWKLKGDKNRTVDGFVVEVSEAMEGGSGVNGVKPKPNGKAATFTMAMFKDGKRIDIAKMSNLPDDAVENGFKNFNWYRLRVAEFMVSGWNGQQFRWPRFVRWRPDKSFNDCQFKEQVGKETQHKK